MLSCAVVIFTQSPFMQIKLIHLISMALGQIFKIVHIRKYAK